MLVLRVGLWVKPWVSEVTVNTGKHGARQTPVYGPPVRSLLDQVRMDEDFWTLDPGTKV
jgi:hypothetical protein